MRQCALESPPNTIGHAGPRDEQRHCAGSQELEPPLRDCAGGAIGRRPGQHPEPPDGYRRRRRLHGRGPRSRHPGDHAAKRRQWRPHGQAKDRPRRSSRGSPAPCRSDDPAAMPSRRCREHEAYDRSQKVDGPKLDAAVYPDSSAPRSVPLSALRLRRRAQDQAGAGDLAIARSDGQQALPRPSGAPRMYGECSDDSRNETAAQRRVASPADPATAGRAADVDTCCECVATNCGRPGIPPMLIEALLQLRPDEVSRPPGSP